MAAYGRVADFLRTPCGLAEINFYRFQDLLLPTEWAAVQRPAHEGSPSCSTTEPVPANTVLAAINYAFELPRRPGTPSA